MPDGVDLRPMARLADERVVFRYRAVVVQAQDLAPQDRGVLRGVEEHTLRGQDPAAGGHVDLAVAAEGDPSVEPGVAAVGRGDHQVLHVAERVPVQPAPREGRRAAAVVVPLRVGEIDQPVVGEVGVERHVHESHRCRRSAPPAPRLWDAGRACRRAPRAASRRARRSASRRDAAIVVRYAASVTTRDGAVSRYLRAPKERSAGAAAHHVAKAGRWRFCVRIHYRSIRPSRRGPELTKASPSPSWRPAVQRALYVRRQTVIGKFR